MSNYDADATALGDPRPEYNAEAEIEAVVKALKSRILEQFGYGKEAFESEAELVRVFFEGNMQLHRLQKRRLTPVAICPECSMEHEHIASST